MEIVPFNQTPAVTLVDIRMNSEKFPRIVNLPKDYAERGLATIVAMAYSLTGREYTAAGVVTIAQVLYSELIADDFGIGTGNITLEEIGRAVKRAVLGSEEMYGINPASLYKVICEYCKGEGHFAQQEANERVQRARREQIAKTPAGVMLAAYESKTLKNTKL